MSLFEQFFIVGLNSDTNVAAAVEDALAKGNTWNSKMAKSEIQDLKNLQCQQGSLPPLEPQVDYMYQLVSEYCFKLGWNSLFNLYDNYVSSCFPLVLVILISFCVIPMVYFFGFFLPLQILFKYPQRKRLPVRVKDIPAFCFPRGIKVWNKLVFLHSYFRTLYMFQANII